MCMCLQQHVQTHGRRCVLLIKYTALREVLMSTEHSLAIATSDTIEKKDERIRIIV